jgi:hypothetical protein
VIGLGGLSVSSGAPWNDFASIFTVFNITVLGGAAASGMISQTVEIHMEASGAAIAGGTASLVAIYTATAAGGMTADGTSTVGVVSDVTGGLRAAGVAECTTISFQSGIGGCQTSGTVQHSLLHSVVMNGGVQMAGTGLDQREFTHGVLCREAFQDRLLKTVYMLPAHHRRTDRLRRTGKATAAYLPPIVICRQGAEITKLIEKHRVPEGRVPPWGISP